MIERRFHPIGQGAFYSEKHDNFNIVYDCGTEWKNRANTTIDKTIKQSFNKNDEIDILFISHFDYDHVSKIKTLKDHVGRIKKVVMPLLHDNEKHLLTNIYRALNFNILTLINNPRLFFGQETQIITVDETDNNHDPINDNSPVQNLDSITVKRIKSGTVLQKKFSTYEWIYIPYNYCYSERNEKLETLITSKGLNFDKFINDPKYTIDQTIENRTTIKDIYSELKGNINQNSMLLYSGIHKNSNKCEHLNLLFRCQKKCHSEAELVLDMLLDRRWGRRNAVGCVYTGDTDLNKVKIKSIFRDYWESVGTIQIPHHGDLKSFDKSILDDKYYWCPISVGEKKRYGHPSSRVIADIRSHNSYPILVTENLTSSYIEHIRC
jgi:beta-lactamase superfamily II metal-dependent hydrolase